MEENRIDQLLIAHSDKFPASMYQQMKNRLAELEPAEACMYLTQMKDPTVMLVLSIFLGQFGIDRMLLGDVGLGLLKLLTCGGFGIWWIIDIFLVMNLTRFKNAQSLMFHRIS